MDRLLETTEFLAAAGAGDDGASYGASEPSNRAARPGRRPRPPKLYRIGEVVDYSGLSRQTVHNYTIMGLLQEAKWTEGGHRLYDESVFARLDLVAELKAGGKSLVEIREHCARLDGTQTADSAASADKAENADST